AGKVNLKNNARKSRICRNHKELGLLTRGLARPLRALLPQPRQMRVHLPILRALHVPRSPRGARQISTCVNEWQSDIHKEVRTNHHVAGTEIVRGARNKMKALYA